VKGAPITDIERSVKVGIGLMPTTNTNKNGLALAIGFVAVPALMASPGRVASLYRLHSDAVFARNVRNFQEQRRERPAVLNQSLFFSDFDSASNAFEVFDGYRPRADFQGFVHDSIRHIPEQPFDRSFLFARQPLQEPSLVTALVPCGLKISALFESSLSNVFDNSTFENLACTGRGDTDNPRIDADTRIALRLGNIPGDDQMQIPDSTFAGDCGCWLDFPGSVEILPMVVRENQLDSGSAVKRSESGVFLLKFDGQGSGVVAHRRCLFPSVMLVFISLVGLRRHIASRANEIGRKFRRLSYIPIGDVVKRDGVEDFFLESNRRSVIERYHVSFLSLGQRLRSLCGRLKFYLQRKGYLHISGLYQVNRYGKRGLRFARPPRNADFLRRLKDGGLHRRIL
jgi:hypothetical protein